MSVPFFIPMVETERNPKFRIRIEDIENKKYKVITIYTEKKFDLEVFKNKLKQKIKEIE